MQHRKHLLRLFHGITIQQLAAQALVQLPPVMVAPVLPQDLSAKLVSHGFKHGQVHQHLQVKAQHQGAVQPRLNKKHRVCYNSSFVIFVKSVMLCSHLVLLTVP